jgi:hypothetical protein
VLVGLIMTNQTSSKLSSHTTWLFAFGAVAAGIASSFALQGLGQKVTAAIYFAVVAIGGFASTYMTKARVRGAVLSFVVAATAAAIGYFFLVDHIVSTATTVMTDTVSNGSAHEQGVQAGAAFGKTFGIFVAVIVFLESIVAGIGGAIAGDKARGQGGLAALGSMARSAR